MRIEGPFTAAQLQNLESLRALRRGELRILFRSLEPPSTTTLVGEYDAELLDQGSRAANFITRLAFSIHGPWTGKAFAPVSSTEGVGYNCFRYNEKTVDKLPLRTELGPSQMDDGQSLIIRYQDYNRGIIRSLIGELRQIDASVILGFGIFGPKFGDVEIMRRKIPFVMVGPRREYMISSTRVRVPNLSKIA